MAGKGNMSLKKTPLSDALGAEIHGVDIAAIDDATYVAVRAALLDHHVLLFRDQDLNHTDLVAFSRRFGNLDEAPPNETGKAYVEGFPEVLILSNIVEDGVSIGALGDGEAAWHTDMNYLEIPPMGSVLYCLETPDKGGRTGFLNMYAALGALPPDLRGRVEAMSIKHDSSTTSAGDLRVGSEPVTDLVTCLGAVHPIIRTHPETGRPVIYLGRRGNSYVMGLSLAESEELLDELWDRVTQERFSWHHSWRPGDVLMWDNRSTMHRRDAFSPKSRRVMYRTQISGP